MQADSDGGIDEEMPDIGVRVIANLAHIDDVDMDAQPAGDFVVGAD